MVLAPSSYYADSDFSWFEEIISGGVSEFAETLRLGVGMDFSYRTFPKDFGWPNDTRNLLRALKGITPAFPQAVSS